MIQTGLRATAVQRGARHGPGMTLYRRCGALTLAAPRRFITPKLQLARSLGNTPKGAITMQVPKLSENLTLLEPQSRCGGKPLKLQVVCPQNGTAVLKGLKSSLKPAYLYIGYVYNVPWYFVSFQFFFFV